MFFPDDENRAKSLKKTVYLTLCRFELKGEIMHHAQLNPAALQSKVKPGKPSAEAKD